MTDYRVDAVIIGGGIAGLFTLAKLTNAGYQAVLLEKEAIGSGQTICSQGIIHGGTKYALLGQQTTAQQQIANMPLYWRDCLRGQGDIDLSHCKILADKQIMWAMPNLSSRVTGFFAGKMMKSRVVTLTKAEKPSVLKHPDCKGAVYGLDEPVLSVQSLIQSLVDAYSHLIITDCDAKIINNKIVEATFNNRVMGFATEKVIYTAGQGNQAASNAQQLRPLRMLYARVPKAFGDAFLHILEASDKPRLTITSYNLPEHTDEQIWYIGGNIAEKGANLSHDETVQLARKELQSIFTWLDFSGISFESLMINRAEGLADGKRPDTPTVLEEQNMIVAWPTKLAMAPLLADTIIKKMKPAINDANTPFNTYSNYLKLPIPRVAKYPWEC